MRVLAIDPSVNNVGWCLFNSRIRKYKKQWKWGTLKLEGHNYQMKLVDLVQLLDQLVDLSRIDILVTEWPTYFDCERGDIAAHSNFTINLAGVCAYLAGTMGLDHRRWHNATATTWKGSVNKYITGNRFFRVFGKHQRDISEHSIDATMMLRWWLITYGRQVFARAREDFPESPLLTF